MLLQKKENNMAYPLKHIGRVTNTGTKVLIVFRTLPGEADQALVLPVNNLSDSYHDSIMSLVETDQSQEAFEFGEMMFIRSFPDGRPMLQAMQADNRLIKVATSSVTMTPTTNHSVVLSDLNTLIAEQKNCAVGDLYTFVSGAPEKALGNKNFKESAVLSQPIDTDIPAPVRAQVAVNEALTDKDIAKSYRSQADTMYKEAARLRKEAEELDPAPKKSAKAKVTDVA
jgi:hypothetical protein